VLEGEAWRLHGDVKLSHSRDMFPQQQYTKFQQTKLNLKDKFVAVLKRHTMQVQGEGEVWLQLHPGTS
jgi:hypothetical protein